MSTQAFIINKSMKPFGCMAGVVNPAILIEPRECSID
jgi:hypothetical protein